MDKVFDINTVKDTALWKLLDSVPKDSPNYAVAQQLAVAAVAISDIANNRIKLFPYYHPQYTLHDQTHMLRVCELMTLALGQTARQLNPIEVFLLLSSAHFHDQGMVPDLADWQNVCNSTGFKVSLEQWEIENPNLREIRQQCDDVRFSAAEQESLRQKERELLDAHRTEYLRRTHGERSEAIVNQLLGASDLLSIAGQNISSFLGRLCASHVWPSTQLTDQTGFRVDEAVGTYVVNLRYLAVILRLADILDFDQDRTPEALLRTIHFASPVSIGEWAKHRSVVGWEIGRHRIRYTMQCEHPAYQRAALDYMDAIDRELGDAHRIVSEFPRPCPDYYSLDLPTRVARDRIEPKNSAYRYADLEFSLSREEIVKLLMTDKLYQSNALFVRELLQNALDALRYRSAVYGRTKPDWVEGTVDLEHRVDEYGFQIVSCSDNGIGMDESIVRKFLTKVGRSYYRSPEFEQQRVAFREAGVDFDPCARFGIGFMSCFMFGDRITIRTRRDYGPGQAYGDPLIVVACF
jgi:hypothetical protein